MIERRKSRIDRRKGDRRKPDYHCITCGSELRYYISEKITDKEVFWCETCKQMFVLVAQHMEVPYLARVKK
jgi:DNA-directed RNA polymerase subunit RPC12/RpoP